MSKELRKYIETALSKGASKEQITETLVSSGWSAEVIKKITSDFAAVDSFGIPVPAPKMQAHHVSRDLFVYFIIFITLSFSSFAVGSIFFELVDYFFKNLTGHRYSHTNISWALAQLIVAFPIFSLLSAWVNKNLEKYPEKRESLIRKLMIYFILTITAIVSISDLIIVLAGFLKGELTLTFILDSLVVLGISILIFSYYFYEVRQDDNLIKIKSDTQND